MIISALEMHEKATSYGAEEFWNDLMEYMKANAEKYQQQCSFRVSAAVMLNLNVEAKLIKAGYEVRFLDYDEVSDMYYIQIFWDDIAINGWERKEYDDYSIEDGEGETEV